MCDLMYQLDCLGWFVTARVVYHFDHYQIIPRHPDMQKRSDLRRAAGDAKKQLRCAVFPMDAQCEAFPDVLQQQRWL
jgi:hypothetical protein